MRDLERQAREVERRKAEAAAASTTAQTQPATPATPSGAETQAGGGELATGARATEAEAGEIAASEGPVVAPVAEGNVARDTETETPNAPDACAGTEAAEKHELQAKAQKSDS